MASLLTQLAGVELNLVEKGSKNYDPRVGFGIRIGARSPEGILSNSDLRRLIAHKQLFILRADGFNHGVYLLHSHLVRSASFPVRVASETKYDYWYYGQKLYRTTDRELTAEDVAALANESANRRRLQLEKAHALQAMNKDLDSKGRRESISPDVKVTVWQRDGGRCVECGGNENLEFDHIIPIAMGGSNSVRNLQLLCETCNRRKGASLG